MELFIILFIRVWAVITQVVSPTQLVVDTAYNIQNAAYIIIYQSTTFSNSGTQSVFHPLQIVMFG